MMVTVDKETRLCIMALAAKVTTWPCPGEGRG